MALEQPVIDRTCLEFFGLTQPPFARLADPRQIFQSKQYSLLLEHLGDAATNADSLVVVCGADGAGKSTLLDLFITTVGDRLCCVTIDQTCQSEEDFYKEFLTQIGFREITGTASELANITKEFLVCRGIAGDHVLIIIDNAQLTSPIILDQLRWLCEIKVKDSRVLSLILVGNTDIVRVVDAPAMRDTNFGNHVVFSIRAFSEEETRNYVWHRLGLAGSSGRLKLTDETYSVIHRYSGGIPGLIDKLCIKVLEEAYSLESHTLTEKIVRTAAHKQEMLPHVIPFHGQGRRSSDPDLEQTPPLPEDEGLDPENLLQQIARLSAQLGDLQADKSRALQDIEARNKDIVKLRDELSSQTAEVKKLQLSLTANADEITQQNVALSESAMALLESESKAKELAAELEKETLAREAAENDLAEATATFKALSEPAAEELATEDEVDAAPDAAAEQAAEIDAYERAAADLRAKLQEAQSDHESARLRVADLEKELREREAATNEEIEALRRKTTDLEDRIETRSGELDSLRDELTLRNQILADLETRYQQSQSACELAQQHIASLKSPKELEEIENAASKLAADLEEETHAREAAERELAEATAAVRQLNQQTEELQAKIDDAHAELKANRKVTNERIAEIETLEKKTADLAMQLEESQAECESAQERIAELRDPQELQEIEKASHKISSELRRETRARKAEQKKLAHATAKVEELSRLELELRAAVRDLETDLRAANAHAAEFELLERRTTALKTEIADKTGELEEARKVSDRLAAELEQETGAREGAEIKLAEAASTIEELRQLERELHSAVRDLNADLRLASERAIDSYVLKREVADLKKQLEDSRNECELLRRRARFGNANGHSVSKAAGVASADGTGIDSSSIVERFEQSIRDVSAYQALRKHDPAFYDRLITTYKVLLGQGLTDTQINDVLRAELAEFMEELLPGASDDAIIAYARLIIDQLDELQLDGVEPCLSLLVPQSGPSRDASPVYSEKTRERELDVLERTLRTYDADRVFPTKTDVWPDLEPVFMELIDAFGADNVAALQNSYDPNIDRILVCNVSRTLYSGILNLPNRNAAEALRWLLTP